MNATSRKTPPQQEGQEHIFLDYQHVEAHFIYSFTWDARRRAWQSLCDELAGNGRKGWKIRPLHERVFADGDLGLHHNYQPSLVFRNQVLERTSIILRKSPLLLPLERDTDGSAKTFDEIPIDLYCTVRLFDNGGATCTFRVVLREGVANFRNVHAVLRLAQNVDLENVPGTEAMSENTPLTQAYLRVPLVTERTANLDYSLFKEQKAQCTLHDLFKALVWTSPPPWAPEGAKALWYEDDVLVVSGNQDFQSPFVFTVAQVERDSFLRFRKQPTVDANREVASIFCRLTLDNRQIEQDYLHLSDDYMRHVLRYDRERHLLLNLCLDRRLFFAMSRRGAIALTGNLFDVPSFFVVPSFLNLCEILRMRWHISNIVSARLDNAISEIPAHPCRTKDIVQPRVSPIYLHH